VGLLWHQSGYSANGHAMSDVFYLIAQQMSYFLLPFGEAQVQ
jgi:hypothetical protein